MNSDLDPNRAKNLLVFEAKCKYCRAPSIVVDCFECLDFECGTQKFCVSADIALDAGVYQSKACKRIVELNGGWNRKL